MISRINNALDLFEGAMMVVAMSAATIMAALQVVLRYVFSSPLIWGGEFIIYTIICMSFVGASMGVRYGAHISVDILRAVLPQHYTRWVQIFSSVVGIIFSLALGLLGFQVFWQMLQLGQSSPAMQIPVAWFYLPIGISAIFMVFRYLGKILDAWNEKPSSFAEEIAESKDKLV